MDPRTLYQDLLKQLADIERQQEDKTLPHSDQQLLDQAWDDITSQINDVEELLQAGMDAASHWVDAAAFFEDEEEFNPNEPRPKSPERLLPEDDEVEDDRGCDHCAGCAYCMDDDGYDVAGEV